MKLFKKYRSKAELRELTIDLSAEIVRLTEERALLTNKVTSLSIVNIVPVHRVEQETVIIRYSLPFDDGCNQMPVDYMKEQIKRALTAALEQHIRWDLFTDRQTRINYVSGTLYLAVRKE